MAKNINNSVETTIDLRQLFFSLIAQWKLICTCVILSVCIALLYLRVTEKIYSVDAFIQVESKKGANAALLGQELSSLIDGVGAGNQVAQDEARIIKSRLVIGQTVQQLHLDVLVQSQYNTLWHKVVSPTDFQTTYHSDGVSVGENNQQFVVKTLEIPNNYLDRNLLIKFLGNEYSITDPDIEKVLFRGQLNSSVSNQLGWKVDIYSKHPVDAQFSILKKSIGVAISDLSQVFNVNQGGKQSGIIDLTLTGSDKTLITNILNNILQNYKIQNVKNSSEQQVQTLAFLKNQLPQLKTELDTAEKAFNIFRKENNTVDITQESQLYLQQSIQLETEKNSLKQKQAEILARYTENHPSVAEVDAQVRTIDKKINELNNTLKRLPDIQRQYLQFYRDVEVKNQLYTNLLNTYQTMRVAKAGEIGNVRVIDTAIKPVEPVKPKPFQILILSVFLGGFLGVLIALIRNMFRRGVKDSSELEQYFKVPVYAIIPRSSLQFHLAKSLKKKPTLPILAIKNNDDLAIESLRSLRTAIYFALSKNQNQVILISGASSEVGKSFVSVNLATILAQNGKRVLLIDADLRRGYLYKYFGGKKDMGLTEYLSSDHTNIADITINTEVDLLNFISTGQRTSNPAELFNTGKFEKMLQKLRNEYDHIIVDTPPVLAVTDGIIMSQYTDINLLIVRFDKTYMKEIEVTVNRFSQSGKSVDGLVMNDIQMSIGYEYGYMYRYGYKNDKL